VYSFIVIRLSIMLGTRRSILPIGVPTLHYAGGCSDMNLDNKEYPQVEPRSV